MIKQSCATCGGTSPCQWSLHRSDASDILVPELERGILISINLSLSPRKHQTLTYPTFNLDQHPP